MSLLTQHLVPWRLRLESKMRKFLKVFFWSKLHFPLRHSVRARSFVVAFSFSKSIFEMSCLWHQKGSTATNNCAPHLLCKSQFLFFIARHKPWHFYYANIIRLYTATQNLFQSLLRSENEATEEMCALKPFFQLSFEELRNPISPLSLQDISLCEVALYFDLPSPRIHSHIRSRIEGKQMHLV